MSTAMLNAAERVARLQQYVESDPDNLSLLAELVDAALACGELDVARQAIGRALDVDAGNPALRLRASSVALAEGNCADSLAMTGALLDAGHDAAAVRFNHACGLMGTEDYAGAEQVLQGLDEGGESYPAVVPMRLRALHYLGDLEKAIERGLRHVETHPDDGEVAGMLSLLFFDEDDMANARRWSARALEKSPKNLDALIVSGNMALADEDAEAARGALHVAVSQRPRNGRAWAALGLADLLDFNVASARDHLERAVSYMPSHVGTWVVLGWVQLMLDDLAAAEASFTSAQGVDDTFGEIYGGLAAVAAKRGDWQGAEALSRVARRLDPAAMSGSIAQILKMQEQGQGDAALGAMKSALERGSSPAGGNLLEMLGRVTARMDEKRTRR